MDQVAINFRTGRAAFSRASRPRRSQPGDVCRDGCDKLWICLQCMTSGDHGAYVVSKGRPVCKWVCEDGTCRSTKPRNAVFVGQGCTLTARTTYRKFRQLSPEKQDKVAAGALAVTITLNS